MSSETENGGTLGGQSAIGDDPLDDADIERGTAGGDAEQ